MSKNVERFRAGEFVEIPISDPQGKWVRYSDYEHLQSQLEQLRAENERLKGELIEPSCWHCGVVLTGVPKPRCEDCPTECDVINCDALGCADKLAEQHLDSWK